MKFFEFNQNNSGGSFDCDDKLCHRLLIEADNVDEAVDIAEGFGVYFNGCDRGMDCECCGDRWYRPWDDDAKEFPLAYATFKEDEAEKLVAKYNCTTKKLEKPMWGRDIQVTFNDVVSYAQYMTDHYGWTSPDIRIFYKNGDIKEIYKTVLY
jgi:hypothetical protein